jgi:hypothetical protein
MILAWQVDTTQIPPVFSAAIQLGGIPPPPAPQPAGGGGGPGKLSGKRKKKPVMPQDPIPEEGYAVSPQATPQMPGSAPRGTLKGVRVKMEMLPQEGENPPLWSIMLDTTFTDLDD